MAMQSFEEGRWAPGLLGGPSVDTCATDMLTPLDKPLDKLDDLDKEQE